MTPEQIDRVFGRGRLKMVTGEHVEVFREAVVSGERRRYTKRFLNSTDGDFAHWTEREWKILARLIGHGIGCVPDVVQFDRGSANGPQLVQTYDAGVTVDQWATLLPLYRDGRVFRHAFEDCAHWWALAHYCLKALKDIHELDLVHLDIKGDNVCIPFGPATFDPDVIDAPLYPLFGQLALIDFAFSLVSRESLTVALPIGWQREYDYQSPRLIEALAAGHEGDLRKTRELDWRCDFYSLAAMLKRYLPGEIATQPKGRAIGWTPERYAAARTMILSLRRHHDAELPLRMPHESLIDTTGAMLGEAELAQSLAEGWTLARDVTVTSGVASPLTPMTRIAPPVRVFRRPRERTKDAPDEATAQDNARPVPNAPRDRAATDVATPAFAFAAPTDLRVARLQRGEGRIPLLVTRENNSRSSRPERRVPRAVPALAVIVTVALGAAVAHQAFPDATKGGMADARDWFGKTAPRDSARAPRADATSALPAAAETVANADTPQPAASAAAAQAAPAPATSSANAAAADAARPAPVERTKARQMPRARSPPMAREPHRQRSRIPRSSRHHRSRVVARPLRFPKHRHEQRASARRRVLRHPLRHVRCSPPRQHRQRPRGPRLLATLCRHPADRQRARALTADRPRQLKDRRTPGHPHRREARAWRRRLRRPFTSSSSRRLVSCRAPTRRRRRRRQLRPRIRPPSPSRTRLARPRRRLLPSRRRRAGRGRWRWTRSGVRDSMRWRSSSVFPSANRRRSRTAASRR
jgi:serine/threonine protein kinase